MNLLEVTPLEDELPSAFADRLGLLYTITIDSNHKKKLGQFFTPSVIASFMAGFFHVSKSKIRILDPGAGTGILACALLEFIVERYEGVREIELTVFETDDKIIAYTELSLTYLSRWVQSRGVNIKYYLCKNDFILHNSKVLDKSSFEQLYDVVISNPPYFKIPNSDPLAIVSKKLIRGQPNIYTIFLIIAAKLLGPTGQLIFITPRSFASGDYFKSFREIFFSIVDINYLHLFSSRREAFERDKVLQENIIVVARNKNDVSTRQLALLSDYNMVQISTSTGTHDIEDRVVRNYRFDELVDLRSEQKILHIPSSIKEDEAIEVFKHWKGSFEKYGINISTGPVVDFRNKEVISVENQEGYVPLIYLHNIDKMSFKWPLKKISKSREKGQFIKDSKETKRLVENSDYVLLRRFSSKDDSSKLIATPYLFAWLPNYKLIGLENHINYIYGSKIKLTLSEIFGISGLLNSNLFDVYFRTFNGNTNVSATELRNLPLPAIHDIVKIGDDLKIVSQPTQDEIDKIVEKRLLQKNKAWMHK